MSFSKRLVLDKAQRAGTRRGSGVGFGFTEAARLVCNEVEERRAYGIDFRSCFSQGKLFFDLRGGRRKQSSSGTKYRVLFVRRGWREG